MKELFLFIAFIVIQLFSFAETPKVEGIWTCSNKDCKVEIYKNGNVYDAKLLWSKKEIDENGNPKLDKKNPDPTKRHLPVIGSKTLWDAKYNPETNYFEQATAYRNGKYFCGKFKLNEDGTLTIIGYICSMKLLRFSETWTRIK